MSFFDEFLASDEERFAAKQLASDFIAIHSVAAEDHMRATLTLAKSRKERRIARLAVEEINWRQSKDWLPDFPTHEQRGTKILSPAEFATQLASATDPRATA